MKNLALKDLAKYCNCKRKKSRLITQSKCSKGTFFYLWYLNVFKSYLFRLCGFFCRRHLDDSKTFWIWSISMICSFHFVVLMKIITRNLKEKKSIQSVLFCVNTLSWSWLPENNKARQNSNDFCMHQSFGDNFVSFKRTFIVLLSKYSIWSHITV